MTGIEDAALAWHNAGYCVLPAASDGSKRPGVGSWDKYKTERPDRATLRAYLNHADGIGLVCGAVSGNLEMLEIEGAAAEDFVPFLTAVTEVDPALAGALTSYVERTPSGGYHFLYRVDGPVAGNTKLASRPREPTPDAPSRRQVKMETRGEGGWTICAPSAGQTHPSGGAWEIQNGEAGVLATLRPEQRDLLHAIAMSFDEMPPPEPPGASSVADGAVRAPTNAAAEGTPGADFTERSTWEEILVPHGWRRIYSRGEVTYWQRPGKTDRSVSASTGHQGDWLYVFTTSTEFEAERTYTRFGAYAVLEHNGDFSAAASALRKSGYGATTSRPAPAARHLTVVQTEETSSVPPLDFATLAHSEDGHAALLLAAHGDVIRYCVERGKWYAWDQHRWAVQWPEGMAREYAKRVARLLPEDDRESVRFKQRCLSAQGTTGALRQAAVDPRVALSINDFDAHPRELNSPGGIIDLPTGRLLPPDPSRLHTRMTAVTPDFDADRSVWLNFLDETFDGDQELIEYLQRLMGWTVVGEVGGIHLLPFCHGSGGNGKGVYLETQMHVLGDYAQPAPNDFLMAGPTKHETEIADLAGARMVVCSEINDDARFDEAKVKKLTGGDDLRGRFMHKDFFRFTPSHTLFLVGNADPETHIGGRSFERRFVKIPFLHEVAVPDVRLKDRLIGEHGPAVLAWIVEGAAKFYAAGGVLEAPRRVVASTEAYWSDQDTVGRFVAERCKVGGGDAVTVPVARFREEYESWCRREVGAEPVSAKALTQTLNRMGIVGIRSMTTRFYANVMILKAEDDLSSSGSWYDDSK